MILAPGCFTATSMTTSSQACWRSLRSPNSKYAKEECDAFQKALPDLSSHASPPGPGPGPGQRTAGGVSFRGGSPQGGLSGGDPVRKEDHPVNRGPAGKDE